MTDCPNCRTARERLWHGITGGCMTCAARDISRGPECAEAEKKGYITPAYKAQLVGVGGSVHWLTVHDLVLAWRREERGAYKAASSQTSSGLSGP